MVMLADEVGRAFDLLARGFGPSQRGMAAGGLCHLGIRVRPAKAVEVKGPDMEAGIGKFVAPGAAIEAVSDRQGGREGRAVNIQHDLLGACLGVLGGG